jgi:hypothetical protein
MLTLGEAAKASKVTKSAISKAIKNGRISAAKDELGRYQIDPAELFRVYPADTGNGSQAVDGEQQETGKETSFLQATVEHLRELLGQVEGERDDLRRRLDQEADERRAVAAENRRLTLMLTHQQPPPTTAPDAAVAPVPQTGQQATSTKREKLRETLLTLITGGGGGLAVLYVLRYFGLI